MTVLTISGSLRAKSTNTTLLEAASLLTPETMRVERYTELAAVPAFNPDLESGELWPAVQRWRETLQRADAVVISTPEYAHGLPGSLKNALDWVVGSGELVQKPVGLFHASSRSTYAQQGLREVLTAMNARLDPETEIVVDFPRREITAAELAAQADVADRVRSALAALARLQLA